MKKILLALMFLFCFLYLTAQENLELEGGVKNFSIDYPIYDTISAVALYYDDEYKLQAAPCIQINIAERTVCEALENIDCGFYYSSGVYREPYWELWKVLKLDGSEINLLNIFLLKKKFQLKKHENRENNKLF
jgi:hypothetical protein